LWRKRFPRAGLSLDARRTGGAARRRARAPCRS
jgi:hypothetical protein